MITFFSTIEKYFFAFGYLSSHFYSERAVDKVVIIDERDLALGFSAYRQDLKKVYI